MKRAVSIFLTLIIVFSGLTLESDAASPSFISWDKQIKEISIQGGKNTTQSKTSDSKDTLDSFSAIVNNKNAKPTSASQVTNGSSSYYHVSNLTASLNDSSEQRLAIYLKDSIFYMVTGEKMLPVSSEQWTSFVDTFGSGFYQYSEIPTLMIKGSKVPASESTYSYKQMDGLFHKSYLDAEKSALPTLELTLAELAKANMSVKPNSITAKISDNSNIVWEGAPADISKFSPTSGAKYSVDITVSYSNSYYKGQVLYKFYAKFSSKPDFSIVGSDTFPGELAIVKIGGLSKNETIKFSSNLNYEPDFFYEDNGTYTAYLPVSYHNPIGKYNISITAGGFTERFEILVKDKKFQIQNLTTSKETAEQTILNQKANEQYRKYIEPVRQIADSATYWGDNKFVMPVAGGRITTQFGMIRYTNGEPTSTRHGALDIALPVGTRVGATNDGRVLFAGYLQLTGNTVVIEHGYGLKSWYYHMNSLNVKTNDMVKNNQKIGEVGSTGFSTGPHLHFGFTVKNVAVNPSNIIGKNLR